MQILRQITQQVQYEGSPSEPAYRHWEHRCGSRMFQRARRATVLHVQIKIHVFSTFTRQFPFCAEASSDSKAARSAHASSGAVL